MDGTGIVIGGARRSRSRYEKYALRRSSHVLFLRSLRVAAEWAGQIAARFRDLPQAAHGLAHQRHRRHSQVRSERAVRSNDFPRAVMHHDAIADRVDVFPPLPVRTLQLRKSLEILQ